MHIRGVMLPNSGRRLAPVSAIFVSASLLAAPCLAEEPPASPEQLVARTVSIELADVRANVAELCESRCGEVLLEASEETGAAELQRIGNGLSRINYNDRFIANVLGEYGNSVVYAIVAHEYGHHLDQIPYGSEWTREIRADSFMGCALARRGDALAPTLRWMRHEHFEEAVHDAFVDAKAPWEVVRAYTDTHPPWLQRINALHRGVKLCRNGARPSAVAEVLGGADVTEPGSRPGETLVFGEHRSTPTRAALLSWSLGGG